MTYNPTPLIPKDWEDLVSNIHTFMTINAHKRLEPSQIKYKSYLEAFSKEEHLKQIKETNSVNDLMPNPFGYDLMLTNLPLVIHYLLWTEDDLTQEEIQEIVNQKLGRFACVGYINPPENQSVKELKHYHIFINLAKIV